MKNLPPRLIAVAILAASSLAAADPEQIGKLASAELNSLVELYTHLHQHPELSFREKETAAKLVSELKPLGFEVTPNVGGHGFVAVMKNGAGPTVMVRTDLDALPVAENTGRPYASDVRTTDEYGNDVGVMHACGHDIHMTSFIGTARVLSKLKDQWSGTLVMIGQPAEERGAGAKAMLEDGLFTRFPRPDYVLGHHVDAALESGRIGYHAGYALANVDSVDITIRGVGGHGAYPHNTKDPIVIAAQVILALQTIVSREVRPIDSAVVTVGSIHGGAKHNVISDEVKLQLTVRSYTDEVRKQVLDAIRRITAGIARAAGVPAEREPTVSVLEEEYTPAMYNNPELVSRLLPVWTQMLGEDNVVERDAEMGGEDFSRYGREEPRIPIFMFRIGTIDAGRMQAAAKGGAPLASLHSALYWPVPDTSIEAGVKAMTAAVLELMGKN
jgi:hippurate hydrolase